MEAFADWLAGFGLWTLFNDYDWLWPACEVIHFVGMAMLIGTIGILDLRILGIGKGLPIRALEALVPIGVAGFIMNSITGVLFVVGNPTGGPIAYLDNLAFQIKVLLMLIAGINLFAFYFTVISRAAESIEATGDADASAKAVAATSLVLWFGVILFGRLIMYNDTLLYSLGL